ncbi:MAG: STAS domain-containing protein [Candidatus Polarisedimenticolaceae bacterium]|nr:STAS domain-containing protein [Candidatus Polarisedimenticolaceae bacterium]
MAISTQSSDDGNTLTIQIVGRFEFASHGDFRKAYKPQPKAGINYLIDLSETDYMDSSALGMLLLIKEYAEVNKGTVTLLSPQPDIEAIFKVANFHTLFTIKN